MRIANEWGTWTWIAGLLGAVAGILLLLGFLTPIAAAVAGLVAVRMAIPLGFVTVVAFAIVLLGPGAFSIDGRLFGLREIIIPSRSPK